MEPDPIRAVELFATRNWAALRHVHEILGIAVSEAFSQFQRRHPDGRIQGGVFAAAVRDVVLVELESRGMLVESLRAIEGGFRSVRLLDAADWACRVHLHPRDWTSQKYLPVTEPEVDTLWGRDVSLTSFELAVLWIPSLKTKGLREATLAAVSNMDERTRTLIFAASPLPPLSSIGSWRPEVMEGFKPTTDDLSDFFAELNVAEEQEAP